ncbi:hypothetical protein P153DRAFT_427901 [Dothidotthia symphoricarpi CBS 119687]|uniref:Uncharacterized protein n=1 Tax=Dothidotthia symphoricarpi CBS 119687 TaxID=1392245 RepID=A0A6A6AS93_9PLEO|nr:uncharacterized protein P153DRAFT_427901 [Dothidotthia symphoricarpi CBS 119687]KAF2134028.1 hypothetical protein P153DRAFT_427901 [Dothidotthia symphoricarpi CBS 119687]
MQNYNAPPPPPGYQRPGSTASFAGQQPPPLPPRTPQGYQSVAPPTHSQWASPIQTQAPSAPWNQPQQQQTAGGYNPGTYGAMSGGYAQGYQAPSNPYAPQQHDMPPPPPPKPPGFSAAVHEQHGTQNWPQQPPQHDADFAPHVQQGGYPAHGTSQQPYNNAGYPPPSATPANSYGGYSTPAPGAPYQPPPPVMSPNEQHPAYIPPSLTGQGVQAYMPANVNPMPGIYVPPPPDVPAWQQALHAPLQGVVKKFKYTKPTVDPSFYTQGYQGVPQQPQPQGQYGQQTVQPQQDPYRYGGLTQEQFTQPEQPPPQRPYDQSYPPQQQQYGQSVEPPNQCQQQQYNQNPQYNHQQNQWQAPAPADQGYGQNTQTPYGVQQQQWQPGHQADNSMTGQQHPHAPGQGIQAPKPVDGRTETTPPNFVSEPSPFSEPVSPITNPQSINSAAGYHPGRTDSIGSVALANFHSQRADHGTNSPKPPSVKNPTPPPPRDGQSRFSALGTGGPSDWEHFGAGDEIDDEELFGAKKEEKKNEPSHTHSVELPAEVPSPPTQGWPSPAHQPAPLSLGERRDTYQPTPELATVSPAHVNSHIQAPPPPQSTTEDRGQGARQSTPTQASSTFDAQASQKHAAELKAKDEALEHLRAEYEEDKVGLIAELENLKASIAAAETRATDLRTKNDAFELARTISEKEKVDLRAEIEKIRSENEEFKAESERLKADTKSAETHTAGEKNVLNEQIVAMRIAAQLAQDNAEASTKEKDVTIARLHEDVEGKEDTIKERDTAIAELRRQLEAEKTREIPKPTAADLIPDIDPWYAGSLERYIGMLRGEAGEHQVEDKIKTFKAFLRAESGIRGIEYYDAPPPAPAVDPVVAQLDKFALSSGAPDTASLRQNLSIQVPQAPSMDDEDDYDYSPGGRPVLKRKPTLPSGEPFNAPAQSATILTPTSSVEDDWNKTPVQSPPEEPLQPQYKAYVPPSGASHDSPLPHRQSMSFANIPATHSPMGSGKSRDEIFFEGPAPQTSKTLSRQTSSDSDIGDIPVPAPLSFGSQRPATTAPPKKDPLKTLTDLLPAQIATPTPSHLVEEIRTKSAKFNSSSEKIDELTKTWEKSASLARRKRDDARRERREDNEERNDDLFNSDEISYAKMKQLEAEFEKEEAELKAQEDRAEYQTYIDTVFDKVYADLQADIKSLTSLYFSAENLLQDSETGIKSLENSDAPSAIHCLHLLSDTHALLEAKHAQVALAVADRDKRYKKTEIQPLNAARNFAKLKIVEQQFLAAEKHAVANAKRDVAARMDTLYKFVEDVVVEAVSVEQGEIDRVVAAIRALDDEGAEAKMLDHAQMTIALLAQSSKALLGFVNEREVQLNAVVFEADIALARAEGADAKRVQELEAEREAEEGKLREEYERRVGVLGQDDEEVRGLIARKRKGGEVGEEAEKEKEKRLRMALEEAKRRNGQV